jgi:hypothetical protein
MGVARQPLSATAAVVMAVTESRRERSITSSFKKMTRHHPTIALQKLLPNAISLWSMNKFSESAVLAVW